MPTDSMPPHGTRMRRRAGAAMIVAALAACSAPPSKEAEEAARNTIACQLGGERVVIRFDTGEARMLMPGGDRVTLYQIAAASGIRYSNGMMELRGKGADLQLVRDGNIAALDGCQPYVLPK
jgi:membrane-bound inhibitor of C-type lysozyme